MYRWSPVTGLGEAIVSKSTMGGFCHRDDSDWTVDSRDNVEKAVQKESKKDLSNNRIE